MSDLSITATSVVQGGNAKVDHGVAGASVTAGQAVYLDSATRKQKLADSNGSGTFPPDGVLLNGAASGQPVSYVTEGDVTIGATLTAGTFYFLSATAGGICPFGDLTTGDRVVMIGYAKSASVLSVKIIDTGVTL